MNVPAFFTASAALLFSVNPILLAGQTNSAQHHGYSTSPMEEVAGSGRIPGPDDFSTLLRRTDGVDARIETSGLDPSTAYTVWGVIFNKPQYCATSPCTPNDLPSTPGHDPRVLASVVYVTGGFSDGDGMASLRARLHRAEDGIKPTDTLFGPGLLSGANAEIHFVLRGHGPDSGDPLLAVGSYNAGCTELNPCSNQQATVHLQR